jgi:hypothetical protein
MALLPHFIQQRERGQYIARSNYSRLQEREKETK